MSRNIFVRGSVRLVNVGILEGLVELHFGCRLCDISKLYGVTSLQCLVVCYCLRRKCGLGVDVIARLMGYKSSQVVYMWLGLLSRKLGKGVRCSDPLAVDMVVKWNNILEPYRRSKTVQERNAGWLARRAKKRAKKRALKAKRKEKGKG